MPNDPQMKAADLGRASGAMAVSSVSPMLQGVQEIAGHPMKPEVNLAIGQIILELSMYIINFNAYTLLEEKEAEEVQSYLIRVISTDMAERRSVPEEQTRSQFESNLRYNIERNGSSIQGISTVIAATHQSICVLSNISMLKEDSINLLQLLYAHENAMRGAFSEGVGELRGYPASAVKQALSPRAPQGGCIVMLVAPSSIITFLIFVLILLTHPLWGT